MNIALLSVEFPPNVHGGLGRYAEYYTRHLTHHGHQIWVFTTNPGDLPLEEKQGLIWIFRPLRKTLARWNEIFKHRHHLSFVVRFLKILTYNLDTYRLIKKNPQIQFDVITVHDWMSAWAGILCAVKLRLPIVFHAHNTEYTMTTWGKKQDPVKFIFIAERLLAKIANRIIVPSDKMRRLVVRHGWDSHKISVIHHGYEAESNSRSGARLPNPGLLRSRIQFQPPLTCEDKLLLFVGRLSEAKGVFQLIRAMKIIVVVNPMVKLLVIGAGANQAVASLIRQLQLGENIYVSYHFVSSEEVMNYYRMADICIFPSLYEPFGLVALEAMALGKPVILGEGFPELLGGPGENPTAFFVDSRRPEKIADGVLELFQNPAETARMGEAARNFVNQNFDWNQAFEATVAVYCQAIQDAKKNKK